MPKNNNGPKMVEVSTTMRPNKKVEVTETERDSLQRLGVLNSGATASAEKKTES